MTVMSQIKPGDEVFSADDLYVGTVDRVEGDRIRLAKEDSEDGRHHFVDGGLIAEIKDDRIRLSTIAAVATTTDDAHAADRRESERLDEGLEETFPASDPVSAKHIT